MQREFYPLEWSEVEVAVQNIAHHLIATGKINNISGIYGEARGGLIPAIMLSHKLGLPFTNLINEHVLWVDDIVDSRKTLNRALGEFGEYAALVCRKPELDFFAPYIIPDAWIVFPWEDMAKAEQDWKNYELSRQ